MKSLQFIPVHNSKAKMDKSMIWITKRCLSDYVQGVNRNGNGAGFGRDTPIPFPSQII